MVPLEDHVTGLTGIRPEDWEEVGYGTFLIEEEVGFGNFTTQFIPGATENDVLATVIELIGGLPVEELPGYQGEHHTFDVFGYESAGGVFDGTLGRGRVAISESEIGVYVVGLAVGPDHPDSVWSDMFEPALEALGSWGSAEAGLGSPGSDAPYLDRDLSPEQRVEDLIGRMTLREKLGQMTLIEKNSLPSGAVTVYGLGAVLSGGGGSPERNDAAAWAEMVDQFQAEALAARLRIPILYGVDSAHGHGNLMGATIFPHNIGLGATGDPNLVEQIGRATAVETAASGIRWNYAPVLAIPSDIRWGRTYEVYSQDPSVVSELGAAYVRGLQGESLDEGTSVLATAKHFIGDGSTVFGSSTTNAYLLDQGVTPDDPDLLEQLILPYREAIDAGVGSVMASFSSWGDTKVHADRQLLTGVLRGELGFEGLAVSDWGGVDQVDADYHQAVVKSVNAGIDLNMVPYDAATYMWTLAMAVASGNITEERIDEAVRRVLLPKFRLGLFEEPSSDPALLSRVGAERHRTLARGAVAASAVLLKNDGVLPLDDSADTIFLSGNAADDAGIMAGGWTITWQGRSGDITGATTLREAIEERLPDAEVIYNRHGRLTGGNAGATPDVCIAALGEEPYAEGVGDSADLALPGVGLVDSMMEFCDEIVVVIVSGRPVIITDHVDSWDAAVAAWLPGSEGAGLTDVLFGDVPFTGRLPLDWPASVDDLPLGSSPNPPLFQMGHGLTGSD
ncbi:MAG TPA: glycoside hydrolase family 3 protein [Acidimicrobiia bacterium]|nr:glycoside hydrolase family 3 protein [Acidimicrobiia bacterium]